jgi:hypothetical protein
MKLPDSFGQISSTLEGLEICHSARRVALHREWCREWCRVVRDCMGTDGTRRHERRTERHVGGTAWD